MPEFPFTKLSKEEVSYLLHCAEQRDNERKGKEKINYAYKKYKAEIDAMLELEIGESVVLSNEENNSNHYFGLIIRRVMKRSDGKHFEVMPYDKGKSVRIQRVMTGMYGRTPYHPKIVQETDKSNTE